MSEGSAQHELALVTGGTGFLAAWIIAGLLGRGDAVRTTVRDPRSEPRVRAAVAEVVGEVAAARLQFAVADLLADDGWDAALTGVDVLLHTASPLTAAPGQDLVRTATEGTRRVLSAAVRAGVRRVVLTSSGVTAVREDLTVAADGSSWASPTGRPADAYRDSKIAAERLAWRIASDAGLELVAVLPTFIQGPSLGAPSKDGSSQVVRLLLAGALPAVPRLGWDVVDVRDVVELHLLAMEEPAAAGQRLLGGSGSFLWWRQMAELLRRDRPALARRVPTRTMPDAVIALLSVFDRRMAMMRPLLGREVHVDASRTRDLVGWRPARTAEQSVLDTADGLVTAGALGR